MNGLLNIWKPSGPSSYDVIRRLRRLLPRQVKAGHAGTLDVLAEGVLVVCLGPATRLVEVIQAYDKEYETVACLGATSTTDDAEGELTATPSAEAPLAEALAAALEGFVGRIEQVPPAYSAVHVEGERAYRLARRGRSVELSARPVTIHSLEVLSYEYPLAWLRVCCSSGTYIRALVRDLGAALAVGAYCRQLVRTRIGPFRREQSVRLEDLTAKTLTRSLLPPVEAVPPEARLTVTDPQARELSFGRAITIEAFGASTGIEVFGALDPDGQLVALGRIDADQFRPVKVFPSTE